MNLYRIDTPNGPVSDLLGPKLIRSAKQAREIALGCLEPATVTRISGGGQMREMYTANNGKITRCNKTRTR